jgi:hypothetical protein
MFSREHSLPVDSETFDPYCTESCVEVQMFVYSVLMTSVSCYVQGKIHF